MKKTLFVLLALAGLLAGCEKKIDLKINDTEPKLVVEGSIENGGAPMVTLTRSVGYFAAITPQILANSFVRNAEVYVSDGTRTHKLKEYAIPVIGNIAYYYYSTDSASLGTAITGQLNGTYSLRILAEGKEYTATTTIPDTSKRIDSLWWKPLPPGSDTTKVTVMVKATDPPGYGDYIRYFTRSNQQRRFLPPFNSVFDDLFIDGTTYEVQIQPGIDRNIDSMENDFFFRGDTVTFKLSNIDKGTFDFWRTWEFSYASVGNPFSTPTRILGNISNGALGYWGGYANQFRTLIIPK